jgi:hypothetical protein
VRTAVVSEAEARAWYEEQVRYFGKRAPAWGDLPTSAREECAVRVRRQRERDHKRALRDRKRVLAEIEAAAWQVIC